MLAFLASAVPLMAVVSIMTLIAFAPLYKLNGNLTSFN